MIALILIVCLLLLIQGYSWLWAKATVGKIKLSLRTEETVRTDGEEGALWLQLENTSWLPIPWLELVQPLPEELAVLEAEEWRQTILYTTYLLPKQRVERKFTIRYARGWHAFGKADLHFGDGIGLRDNEEIVESNAFLLVRPNIPEDAALSLRLKELIGEQSVLRWYQEDTSRLQGIRTYQPTDPYKNIHWQATAKVSALMVKQFETTSETDFYVLLNHQFYEPYWMGTNRAMVDQTCRLAAALFCQGLEDGCSFGLVSNSSWPGMGGLTIPLSRGLSALDAVLDGIGSINYASSGPFAELLAQMRGQMSSRATLIVITAMWTEEIAWQLELLRADGHPVLLIVTERMAQQLDDKSPAVRVYPLLEDVVVAEPEQEEQPATTSIDGPNGTEQEVSA